MRSIGNLILAIAALLAMPLALAACGNDKPPPDEVILVPDDENPDDYPAPGGRDDERPREAPH